MNFEIKSFLAVNCGNLSFALNMRKACWERLSSGCVLQLNLPDVVTGNQRSGSDTFLTLSWKATEQPEAAAWDSQEPAAWASQEERKTLFHLEARNNILSMVPVRGSTPALAHILFHICFLMFNVCVGRDESESCKKGVTVSIGNNTCA